MKRNKDLKSWSEMFFLNHRALKLLWGRHPQMVLSHFLSIIWASLTPYLGIYFSALVIGELAGNRNIQRLQLLICVTLVSTLLVALGSALLNKWKEVQRAGLWFKIEQIYVEKMLDMDYVCVDKPDTVALFSTIRQNQNGGGWGLHRVLGYYEELCASVLIILGGIFMTVPLFLSNIPQDAGVFTVLDHPVFVLLMLAFMFGISYAAPALANKAGSYWAANANLHNLGNRMFGFFGWLGHRKEIATDVRIYRQDRFCEKYNNDKSGTFGSNGMFAHLSWGPIGAYQAASAAVSVIFMGVVYCFVCLKAWAGAFGLGAVTQYVASITKVSGGVSKVISTLGSMRNNAAFLEPVFEFLDIPNDMYQGSLTVEKRRDRKYEVEFRNVSFRYPGSDTYALRNVSMKFEIGKRLAVVGMNGSGKTTFIKLLCRLYDPTEGAILLNGIDIRKYNYAEYMAIFSVVFQDFKLFALRLGENVASQMRYDREQVADALDKAGFAERLAELPRGVETYLYKDYDKDGINVSGGEAQKIAIARALYKDAPFIILDEPTAALDPLAEAEIYSKFNDIVGDKTAIYISHRLSSCKFCDEILVFHEGAVIQQGSHASLVADESGKYYELWHAQAQYYAGGKADSSAEKKFANIRNCK